MFGNLTGWHALILIAVVLLLFGATRLPALAKSVGQSVKILRKETSSGPSDAVPATPTDLAPSPSTIQPAAVEAADAPIRS